MRVEIQLRIVGDDGTVISDGEVLHLEQADDRLAAIGLSLAEAKTLLADIQNRVVTAQAAIMWPASVPAPPAAGAGRSRATRPSPSARPSA